MTLIEYTIGLIMTLAVIELTLPQNHSCAQRGTVPGTLSPTADLVEWQSTQARTYTHTDE